MCKYCEQRGQTWVGSDPECAFESGRFSPDNWNCEATNIVRQIIEKYGDISYIGDDRKGRIELIINDTKCAIEAEWYKSRGRTDKLVFMISTRKYPVVLWHIETLINQYKFNIEE